MTTSRRNFLKTSVGVTGLAVTGINCGSSTKTSSDNFAHLKPMTGDVKPITVEERLVRIEKAQRLMTENKIRAILLDSGKTMVYFTGMQWWQSERTFAVIIPAKGDPIYICPKFEEDRARRDIKIGDEVRTWEEDESPFRIIAQAFNDFEIRSGKIGMEERLRFFIFDGVRKEAPHLEFVSADPISVVCRAVKTKHEIELMQKASDITIEAYKATLPLLFEGMTNSDFRALSGQAHQALGVSGGIGAQFGIASSYPHGMSNPPLLKDGDIVLMDGGCGVDGYRSDISRTVVFGEPTKKHREVWNAMSEAKDAVFNKANVGVPFEDLDNAAREVLIKYGYGPDYEVPGCPHRSGHGIGMDGHEWYNVVRGNKRPIDVGMCFSNEPMIVIPGEFGVRLEDCIYMTEDGPKYFSGPSPSIDEPFV